MSTELEDKILRRTSANYEQFKWFFSSQEVEQAVEVMHQREQKDKACKRPRRSIDWDGW